MDVGVNLLELSVAKLDREAALLSSLMMAEPLPELLAKEMLVLLRMNDHCALVRFCHIRPDFGENGIFGSQPTSTSVCGVVEQIARQ